MHIPTVIPVIPVAVPNEYGLGVKRVLTHGNPIYHFKMTINGILECVEALCRNYVIRQIIPGILTISGLQPSETKSDGELIQELFEDPSLNVIGTVVVSNCQRVGKKGLLIVTFDTLESKRNILKNAYKHKSSTNPRVISCDWKLHGL